LVVSYRIHTHHFRLKATYYDYSSMPPEIDVAIIGAGPAGNHCARLLSQRGHKVVVLEKKPRAGTKQSCTGIIGAECFGLFPPGYLKTINQFQSATFFSTSGMSLRVEKSRPQAYIVDRAVFDNQLAQSAQEAGADYWFNCAVETIARSSGCLKIGVRLGSRRTFVEARTAVIAGGPSGYLTRTLGMGEVRDHATGCQTEVGSNTSGLEVYLGSATSPGFFGWLVPLSGGRARLGLLTRGNNAGALMSNLWQTLKARGKVTSPMSGLHYGAIPLKPLSRTYAERTLVIGDAAGQVKPTTGGGIYYGLLCAAMAAERLHEAIVAEDYSAARMSHYQKDWHQKLQQELRISRLARQVFQRLSDKQIDRIFDIVLTHGIHHELLEAEDFSFDWHGRLILKALGYRALKAPFGLLRRLAPNHGLERAAIPVHTYDEGPHIP